MSLSEAEFQDAVVDLARTCGWTAAHFRPARTRHGWRTPGTYDAKGFPDAVLVHPRHGVLFVEMKSATGKVEPEQREWLDRLELAGAQVDVWRPADMERIVTTLSGGRARYAGLERNTR